MKESHGQWLALEHGSDLAQVGTVKSKLNNISHQVER